MAGNPQWPARRWIALLLVPVGLFLLGIALAFGDVAGIVLGVLALGFGLVGLRAP